MFKKLSYFDLVIVHCLDVYKFILITFAPVGVKFAWIGWGTDYYGYIYDNEDYLFLPSTLSIRKVFKKKLFYVFLNPILCLKSCLIGFIDFVFKVHALKRIASFSPVLSNEYTLMQSTGLISHLPPLIPWNYGSLEENLVANFLDERINGDSILIGNSSSLTNNHVDAFEQIQRAYSTINLSAKIIVPLSYGDESYRKLICEKGISLFGDRFIPLVKFMAIDEYVSFLKQIGFAIMNHKRQQGVGLIIILLYLGARLFLRDDSPTYKMLISNGAILNSINELEKSPELLKTPLCDYEIKTNIEVLNMHWSKKAIDLKTKNLVEFHFGAKD